MSTRLRFVSLISLVLVALVVTQSAHSTTRPGSTAETVTAVEGIPVASSALYDGAALAMPTRLAVAGDRLIVLDPFGSNVVHVIDVQSGALIESFGSKGEGPGEFEGARSIDVQAGGDAFWVHDVNLQRSTLYALEAPPAPKGHPAGHREQKTLSFVGVAGVTEPIRLSDDRIMAGGMFDKGRLGHLDGEGRLVRASGPFPEVSGDLPGHLVQFIHQGAFRGTPARDRFALSSLFFTRIELYDRHGTRQAVVEPPVTLDPEIITTRDEDGPAAYVDPLAPMGYTDIAVTDAGIFALYSGRDPSVYREEAAYGSQVHVFTWAGEYLGAIDLGYDAAAIAVSDDGTQLYGARHFPASEIRRHTLPERYSGKGEETRI